MIPVHAIGIAHGLAGLNAHEDFVRAGVVTAQIVRIVGGDQRDAGFLRELVHQRDQALVLIEAVVLNLEEEIVAAEDVGIGVGEAAGVVVTIGEDGLVELAAQAG